MESVLMLFLLMLSGAHSQDQHFTGGSMSFKFIDTSIPDLYKLQLTAISGWVLGKGPCGPNCTLSDVGKSTNYTRREMLDLNGHVYFGNWTEEIGYSEDATGKAYPIINANVSESLTGEVAAVNVPMGWEQEIAEIILNIDPLSAYTDISFHGNYWRQFDYEAKPTPAQYHIQVKVQASKRSDTGQPNNSPVAMFKPVYKILLNHKTTIKLSTMDQDGDFVRCEYAMYVEAGGLEQLRNTEVTDECSVIIEASTSDGYKDGGWGAIPVKVSDYSKTPITFAGAKERIISSSETLSSINVQFMFQTLSTIEAPVFVEPTKESRHEFNVYAGSQLKIELYAKPSDTSPHDVASFSLRSVPRRRFTVPSPTDVPSRPSVKNSTVTWRPTKDDIGVYVISALVTDTDGSDGLDRNYNILVKDVDYTAPDVPASGPYFTLFPNFTGIICMRNSTCSFPIYSKTKQVGGIITSVNYTTSTFEETLIEPPEAIKKDGKDMFVTDVVITSLLVGDQRICFQAWDDLGGKSEIKCLGVYVKIPNPCASHPCMFGGTCVSHGEKFTCKCARGFGGLTCSEGTDFCVSSPCAHGKCYSYPVVSGYYVCQCDAGYTGSDCDVDIIDCKPSSCTKNGVCRDLLGNFTCDCFSGYTGNRCETTEPACQGFTCDNEGICVVEKGNPVCKCPLGYHGDHCRDKTLNGESTIQSEKNHKEAPFTVPTPANGAEIQCIVSLPCQIPLYVRQPTDGSTPSLAPGLHSPDLPVTLDPLSTHMSPNLAKTLQSKLIVTPSKLGKETVCVKSGKGTKSDTVCFNVNVKMPIKGEPDERLHRTKFLAGSLPDKSTINCIEGTPCHVVFNTGLEPSTNSCALASGSASAIAFPSRPLNGVCHTDVLFIPPTGGDNNVCLRAGDSNPTASSSEISQGEQRCFVVHTATKDNCDPNPCNQGECIHQPQNSPPFKCICQPTSTGKTCQHANPCQSNTCHGNGYCVKNDTDYHCDCQLGYSGPGCQAEQQKTPQPELTDPTMPYGATIQCKVGETCTLPIYTKGPRGNLVKGPVSGGVDVKLTRPTVDKSGPNLHRAELDITPDTAGDKKVCVKTTSGQPTKAQQVCYNIHATSTDTAKPEKDNFNLPSPLGGSVIPCPNGKTCHVLMHSKPDENNTCPQVMDDQHAGMESHIFPTKLDSGSCVTDVTFTPDPSTGTHQLCLKSRLQDSPRCYTVDPDTTDHCHNKDCGHGACIAYRNHSTSCVCDDTHTGTECKDPAPCKSSPCQHQGICKEDGSTFTCHCPVGYTGSTCQSSIHAPTNSKPTFSGISYENGSTLNCIKDQVCKLPISIAKHSRPPPVLNIGPASPDLNVKLPEKPSKDTDTPGRHDLYKSLVEVTPTETGDKKICVKAQDGSISTGSTQAETVCYHLHVEPTGPAVKDSFTDPTPASGSKIRCVTGKDCHIIMHSKPMPDRSCPQVTEDSKQAYVFPSKKDITFTDCITDISVPEEVFKTAPNLCFKARASDTARCFDFDKNPTKELCAVKKCDSAHGACILETNTNATCFCTTNTTDPTCNPCLNHGIEDGSTCHCPMGYTGTPCEEAPSLNATTKSRYSPINIQNGGTIQCEAGKPCTFAVHTQAAANSLTTPPLLNSGPKSEHVTVDVSTSQPVSTDPPIPGLYATNVTLSSTKKGTEKVCFQLTDATTDSICYKASFKDKSPTTTPSGVTFTDSTLPNQSEVLCEAGHECHMLVYTNPNSNQSCDDVSSSDALVFPTTKDGPQCVTDIAYKPGSGSTKNICVDAGISGEHRCFVVNKVTQPDPCEAHAEKCNNHGSCLRVDDALTECVCNDSYTGPKCKDILTTTTQSPTTTPPCSSNGQPDGSDVCQCALGFTGDACENSPAENTNSTPKYSTNNMKNGGTIKCERDKACTFPLYTQAPALSTSPPSINKGPKSGNVIVDVKTPKPMTNPTGVPGLYSTPVTVTPHENGKICFNLTDAEFSSVCYKVDVGGTAPATTSGSNFAKPTLPGGSTLLCDTECHLLVHTEKNPTNHSCDQVHPSTGSIGTALSTKTDGGECLTDVIYKPDSTIKQLCIDAGPSGEHRCYTVEKMATDSCKPDTCKGHGSCLRLDDVNTACVCDDSYSGNNCETEITTTTTSPTTTAPCSNDGLLNGANVCQCPLGYSGDTCENSPAENTDTKPKYSENNLKNGGTVQCEKDKPCTFPIYSQAPKTSTSPPSIKKGPKSGDMSIDVKSPKNLTTSTGVPGLFSTPVTLTPHDNGTVCFNLTDADVSSVCYQVAIGGNAPSATTGTDFAEPTLPSGSTLVCETECHLLVHTEKNPANHLCEQVKPSPSSTAAALNTKPDGGECLTDVIYKPDATSKQLCLDAGPAGEQRCYTVEKMTKDKCQPDTCKQHGSCLRIDDDNTKCICDVIYSGSNCETEIKSCVNGGEADSASGCKCPLGFTGNMCEHSPVENTDSKPKYSENNMKNGGTIKCQKDKPCTFPLYTQNAKTSTSPPSIKEGPKSGNVSVDVKLSKPLTSPTGVPGMYSTPVTVTPHENGKICFNLTDADVNSVCYQVAIGGSAPSTTTGSNFASPTLPGGSTLLCEKDCHLLVHTDKNPTNHLCDQVTSSSSSIGTALETKPDGSECVTDIVYQPDKTTNQLCLDAGPAGEQRCYTVENMTTDKCQPDTCKQHGSCLRVDDDNTVCVCDASHSGSNCETEITPCSNGGHLDGTNGCQCPLGFTGHLCQHSPVGNVDSKPKYSENNMKNGGTIQCEKDKPCTFPIFTQAPNMSTSPPSVQTGPKSGNMIVDVKTPKPLTSPTGVPGLYSTPVTVTPHENGKICFNLTDADVNSVCYQVAIGGSAPSTTTGSNFASPTLPGGSTLLCEKDCHLLVHTDKNPTNHLCDQVTSSSSSIGTALETKPDGSECVTDIVYQPDKTTNQLCLDAGPAGEQRCYTVENMTTDKCQPDTCKQHGSCLRVDDDNTVCVCDASHSGSNCETEITPCSNGGHLDSTNGCQCPLGFTGHLCQHSPVGNVDSKPKYSENNMKNGGTIQCEKDKPCTFPIFTQAPNTSTSPPSVQTGPKSGNMIVDVKTPKPLTSPTGVPGLYSTPVTVTPHENGKICFNLTDADVNSVCYQVAIGGIAPSTTTGSNFASPTLPGGSTLLCEKDCHLLVHTDKNPTNHLCDQVTSSSSSIGTALETKPDGSECVTDIVYQPDKTTNQLCLDAGPAGEQRCYTVENMTTDKCQPDTCKQHGSCLRVDDDNTVCVCDASHSGSNCETEITPCSNGGHLDSTNGCQCPLGFTGHLCQHSPVGNVDSKPKYSENNMKNGGTIQCEKDKPCTFPIYTQAPNTSTSPPSVQTGPKSGNMSVDVKTPKPLTSPTGVPGLYSTPVILTPHEKGNVCFNLTDADVDSVCYQVAVGGHAPTTNTGSSFAKPTLPGGSSLVCKTECHILVHTDKNPTTNSCDQVQPAAGSIGTALNTKPDGSECVTDVVYKPDSTNKKLCLDAGPAGEQRCYTVEKMTTDKCQPDTCKSHGSCLRLDDVRTTCVCDVGHTGSNCDTEVTPCNGGQPDVANACHCPLGFSGVSCENGPPENTDSKPKYSENNLKNGGTIKCEKDKPCTFPLYTQTPKSSTSPPIVKEGPKSGSMSVDIKSPKNLTTSTGVPGLYSTPVTVTPHEKGEVCFNLTDADVHSVCYQVEVGGNPPATSITGPNFAKPTLPGGSTLLCETECHLLVHTETNPTNHSCDQVKPSSGSIGVVLGTKPDTSECLTDVVYKPDSTNKQLCLDAGSTGEKRCFTVEKTTTNPCTKNLCNQHGSCLRLTDTDTSCVCDVGYSGTHCETELSNSSSCHNGGQRDSDGDCQCPLGYSGNMCQNSLNGNTGARTKFAKNNMENGGTIKCEREKPCTFPVYTETPSSSTSPPTVTQGPSSAQVDVDVAPPKHLSNSTGVPGLYSTPVTVTPHQNGPNKVCLKITDSATDSVCYNIDVTDVVPTTTPTGSTFNKPTLPGGSTVLCKDSECHLLVHTKPNTGTNVCDQVAASGVKGTAFKTSPLDGECVTDILYKPDTTNKTLCVEAGLIGEKRCYPINKSTKDLCSTVTCNHGSCLNKGSTTECVCESGYTDSTCSTESTKCKHGGKENPPGHCICPLAFTGGSCESELGGGSSPKFASNNLENGGTINCVTGKPCIFPINTQAPTGSSKEPKVLSGPSSGDVNVGIDPAKKLDTPTKQPGLYSTPVTLTATTEGEKKVCFKIEGGSQKDVCYTVNVANQAYTTPATSVEPVFSEPTLTDGSTVPCSDNPCHLLVHTKPNSLNTCEQVQTDRNTDNAFRTTKYGGDCVTDVAFTKGSGSDLCIKAGDRGEKRCYTVEHTDKTTDPCQSDQCNGHGSCLRKNTIAECVCETGYMEDNCQKSVAQSLGVDDKKPHIIEPTISSGSLIQCEVNKPCKIPIVASPGSSGSPLEKPTAGSSTPVKDENGNYKTDIVIPTSSTTGVKQHCFTLKTAAGDTGEPWCVLINNKPQPSGLTPHTDHFTTPTLPDGSVIPCTVGTTCTLPVSTETGHTLLNPTGLKVPHVIEKDPSNNNADKIKITPTDKHIGDNNICIETADGSSKRCYIVRVQQNPDALANTGTSAVKSGGTSTPSPILGGTTSPGGHSGSQNTGQSHEPRVPKVIGPSPLNGTTMACGVAGCDLKLLVQTPPSEAGPITSVGNGDPRVTMTTDTKKSPNLHSVGVTLKPDPLGPDHQTICMEVKMTTKSSTPWCVDLNVDKSGTSALPKPSTGEIVEPIIVPCHAGSACLVPVTTPIDTPLLSPLDNQTSVQGSTISPDGKTTTHTVSVTPTSSQPPIQKICLKAMTSATDTTTNVKRCVQVEVLPKETSSPVLPKPTDPPNVASHGLGVDTTEPHVLQPTMTSGTTMPCETKCSIDVVVDPGANPEGGVELVPTKGSPITTPEVVPTKDGKYKIKVDITPNPSLAGLQPICFKVKNKHTQTEGSEWCMNVNPHPDPSTTQPTTALTANQQKDIVSSSLPNNTVLTCTVDTTCSVDIKTTPGAGTPDPTGSGPIIGKVTTDPTDPHKHVLSVTPSSSEVGEHTVCVKTEHDDKLCYKVKVTPNPNTLGHAPNIGAPQSNDSNRACGPNDHLEVVGPGDASVVACPSSGCSFHVLVKPPSCKTSGSLTMNPEHSGQFTQGPVTSVGSLKEVELKIGPHVGGSSENICMMPIMGSSVLPTNFCVTLNRTDNSGGSGTTTAGSHIANPSHIACEPNKGCPIPFVTTPDRLLQQTPEMTILSPTISGSKSLQTGVYHPTATGTHDVCVDAVSTSNSADVQKICLKIDVGISTTTTPLSHSTLPATTIAPGKGAPKDFIPPDHVDETQPHVLEPSSSSGSTIQCKAGTPCNIPLVVDTGIPGSTISGILVNQQEANSTTPSYIKDNKYRTTVTVPTTGLHPGANPSCITVRTTITTSRSYCVYVNFDPHPTPTVTPPDPQRGLDPDHSLPEGSVIQCTVGDICSIPVTERPTDPLKPYQAVDTKVPFTITAPPGMNTLEKAVVLKPTAANAGNNKICIETVSDTQTCYMLHVKKDTDTSGANPSGGKPGDTNSGSSEKKPGNTDLHSGSNPFNTGTNFGSNPSSSCTSTGCQKRCPYKPKILGPGDGSKTECSPAGCKISVIVETPPGSAGEVVVKSDNRVYVQTLLVIPMESHKSIAEVGIRLNSEKPTPKICLHVSVYPCGDSVPICLDVEQLSTNAGAFPPQPPNTKIQPVQIVCHVGTSCHIVMTTDTLRPFLEPTDGHTAVQGEIISPTMEGMLHEVVINPDSAGKQTFCLNAKKTPFDSSPPERHCVRTEILPPVTENQCSGTKPMTQSEALKAYSSGRLTCMCGDGTTKTTTLMRPRVSNGKLLRMAGLGFGGGVGTLAVAALIYLAVTKIQSKSKDKDRSNHEMYDLGFN